MPNNTLPAKLILMITVFAFAILILFLWDATSSRTGESNIPVVEETENKNVNLVSNSITFTEEEIKKKFEKDPTIKLGGMGKKIYFLDKATFLVFATKANRNASSIDDFRIVLMDYLSKESLLVQELFQSDTAVLWKYISDNNSDIIKSIDNASVGKSRVHQLKDWNALMVYRIGDKVLKQDEIKIKKSEPLDNNTKPISNAKKTTSIPSVYKATIDGKLLQLRLKKFVLDGDSLRFVYEIPGKHKHYNKPGAMNMVDGITWLESLGKAKIKTKNIGTATIIIEKGNYEFQSLN